MKPEHTAETAAPAGAAAAVTMRGITKRFPGVVANDRVDFEARVGEVHALLGENGAGKSTLSNILTGLYHPDEGELSLFGEPVAFASPKDALDAGVGMVHQHFRLVEPFTVAENVVLGDHRDVGRRLLLDRRATERRVAELADRYGLGVDPRARVWQLSVGEQQRVEILKTLYRDARILILDEPTAVLTPQEADALFATLRAMAAEGRTVVFISHKLHEVTAVADRVTVLRGGRSVATVVTAEVTRHQLAALMVGRDVDVGRRRAAGAIGDPVLVVEGLGARGDRGVDALRDVSLTVRAGEVLGVAGVAGNGQRELAEAITGLRPLASGSVRVAGRELRGGDPREAIRAGVAHVPEDRLHTGVAPSLSISANVVLKSYKGAEVSAGPFLRLRRIRDRALDLIRRYDVRAAGPSVPARLLSGGNLQKVVLAREFSGRPTVLVAAAPTRGLDVGAIETVHGYLRDAAAAGVGVLLISEDLDEVLALADRIVVMYEGELVGEVDARSAGVDELGLLMAGVR
jgi:simple sugar transport system ATP-binding protein